ncbi:hypothetical protein M3181_05415 [Mesobacillus maritimus]|uniref:hypothetical protein n=1 Tax=Mesobacillus maritimus TaxID=1643336 RepID=UPI00203A4344|nr:hypothetical protein [Mesobacillus maritimus]MCM3668440.1 hypothetical protein [Mesobacillus maritimus]
MEPKQPGSEKLPDFKELEDRVIAEAPSQPMLVIKTNLDPKNSTEDNPYYRNLGLTKTEQFRNYFEERKE